MPLPPPQRRARGHCAFFSLQNPAYPARATKNAPRRVSAGPRGATREAAKGERLPRARPPPTLSVPKGKRSPPQAMGRAATKRIPRSLAARDARRGIECKEPQGRMLRIFYSVAPSQDAERAALRRMKTHSFLESCKVWGTFGAHFGAQTKKVRAYKALTWRFNGAGDGNRTRVRSLEGFSSTIEPHPRMVGTTGFEPATSCSQSRRATKLRHVPSTVQLGYYNKARRMFKKISFNSKAPELPP